MAKRKHSADWMLARVREYLSGKGSYRQIARANGISVQSLRGWVRKYEKQGEASFIERAGNASYSKEFKASCVLALLRGEGSVDDIVAKYNISSRSVLRHWMKQYNDHIELADIIKPTKKLDEMERLRRENQRLKRQLEEPERLVYFLKKLKALEGR